MKKRINLQTIFTISDDVVAREIEGEIIIVPLKAGIGDMEDMLFTANDMGKEVWKKLDGKKSLKALVGDLASEYDGPIGEIERDVVGFIGELLKRGMVIESPGR